jgi:PAS domain S-box-containing protein
MSVRQYLFLSTLIFLIINGILGYNFYKSSQKPEGIEQWSGQSKQVNFLSNNTIFLAKDIEAASKHFTVSIDRFLLKGIYTAQKKPLGVFAANTLFLIAGFTILLLFAIGTYLFLGKEKDKRTIELNKATHLYAFISQVNQNIVRVKDEETLFKNACKMALEFGKFRMAWIGKFDTNNQTIRLIEQSGIPAEVLPLFIDAPIRPNGPQDRVLRKGTHYICNDVWDEPELIAWKPFATKYDIRSCMVLPVKKSGNIVATLNLYSSEINFANEEEIKLLVEVAGDISFALDMFEKERIYKYAQELIIQNEKRFRVLIEKSVDVIALANMDGELIYGSPSIIKILGYSMDELLRLPVFEIIHPSDIAEFRKNRDSIIKVPGQSFYYQQRRRHKNGQWVWCEGSLTNLLEEPD